ncbi:nucleoside-diphosphate-sugar epimerase [Bradyrhizobium sp. JR4.1]
MANAPFELKGKSVYVAGHRGMVGSALVRRLAREDVKLITVDRREVDLCDQAAVFGWFAKARPQVVFLAAAKVGGIVANNTLRAEFIYDNLAIAANVIHAAHVNRAEKLMFLGSSCIYPKLAPQPLHEDTVLTGPLEPTNEPYAIAKIAGIKMAEAYRSQYGSDFISVMPTNLYGPGDNYHPELSHVVAALIRRFHEAKLAGAKNVVVWGTGTPRREFLYVDDMADACVHLMKTYSGGGPDQHRHRRGHHHSRIGPRRCRGRRLQRRFYVRSLASRRHAAQAARRQPPGKARLACHDVICSWNAAQLPGLLGGISYIGQEETIGELTTPTCSVSRKLFKIDAVSRDSTELYL